MESKKVRKLFCDFFESKQHKVVESAPMVIKDDPTLMFTNAGMNQFKDIFLDIRKPRYTRIVNAQKCLRVSGKHNDIEDVGHDTYHHTMFEMLGNWSFGDYFKEDAIKWAWELLTEIYKIDKNKIYVTVFGGNKTEKLEIDTEAENIWAKYIDKDRILHGSKKDNFWEMGDTGPCGPCSEIHVDIRDDVERKKVNGKDLINKDHPEVIEIWNLVFIQFNRKADSSLEILPAKHIDTGMGFERLCMILQNKKSNYETDIFSKILNNIEKLSEIKYGKKTETDIAMRVVADHLRSVSFAIADGQMPSNVKAGYVIRRILRRAVRYGYSFLNFNEAFIYKLVPVLVNTMGEAYPELISQKNNIEKIIMEEEKVFLKTLEKGLKLIEQKIKDIKKKNSNSLSGEDAFILYDTYGFPLDLTELIAKENNISIDIDGFNKEMNKQKSRARNDADTKTGDWTIVKELEDFKFVGYEEIEQSVFITKYRKVEQKGKTVYNLAFNVTPFYAEAGGQAGDTGFIISKDEKVRIINTITEHNTTIHITDRLPKNIDAEFKAVVDSLKRTETAKNHSATHLMHYALRKILGKHVEQKGSLVDENRLRFDFSHFNKLTNEEIREIEKTVNSLIRKNITIKEHRNIPLNKAKEMGAISLFGEKYGDSVRVIKFDDAVELCGGTHVNATGEIGFFKITSEAAIASGIRRIEAVIGDKAEELIFKQFDDLNEINEMLNNPKDIKQSISKLIETNSELIRKTEKYKKQELQIIKNELVNKAELINNNNIAIISGIIDVSEADDLKEISSQIRGSIKSFICILGTIINQKPSLIIAISDDLVKDKNLHAGKLIRLAAKEINGGGGGQAFIATAGGNNPEGLENAINLTLKEFKNVL